MDSDNPEPMSQFSFSSNDLISVQIEKGESARKFKVLVVEHDSGTAQHLLTTLARAGMECRHALDGALALEALQISDFHLILLDLSLPQTSGQEVCRQVRKRYTLPIIVMTAGEETEAQLKCFGLGADDYLIKPFSSQLLVIRVVSLLRRTYVYNKKKHPHPVPFSSLPISVTLNDPHVRPLIKPLENVVPLATPETSEATPKNTIEEAEQAAVLPPGWSRCDICDYMGPTARFTTQDDSGRPVMACPHCGDTANIQYALG
ncbi:MAG TPA: response regulator transcription factor [Abditibacteriaceae bacterium]|jgi:CheY-like chemotaxis protein